MIMITAECTTLLSGHAYAPLVPLYKMQFGIIYSPKFHLVIYLFYIYIYIILFSIINL